MNLTITTFQSRRKPIGSTLELTWEEFKDKLREATITSESISEYFEMTNEQRTEIKDVGGYVAGRLEHGRRSKSSLVDRCIVTIDSDYAKDGDWENFCVLSDLTACCHTTHSSTPDNPRLRWLFPLSRPVDADEYRVVAKELANLVGVDTIDESTDQPERLMFWPSVPFDVEYRFWEQEGKPFDVDDFLSQCDYVAPPKAEKKERPIEGRELSVEEGRRNKTVFGFAASLRGQGLDEGGIREMITTYSERYCYPPLSAEELDTITRSVCSRYEAGEAVAGTLRDAWDDFNDMGEWREREPEPIKKLSAESMSSLAARHVDAPVYVVENLISTGITILASPPKFGKSWMCMDLAISVANGTEFMGLHTEKKGVIYMALEDGDYRLQDRGLKVAGNRSIPSNLYLVKDAPILADGLLGMLEALVAECGDIGMVIIDTLQKIRGTAGKTEGVYGYDYRELGQLHKYALDRGIALILVHHLNKGGDDSDFVGRLNGSTGISGAADSIITLSRAKRGDKETKMSITGRDVTERTLVLQMDWGTYRWTILGEEHEVAGMRDDLEFKNDPVIKTIIYHMDEAEELALDDPEATEVTWSVSPTDLLDEIERLFGPQDITPANVGRKLASMGDKLERLEGIAHEFSRTGKNRARTHVFTRELF